MGGGIEIPRNFDPGGSKFLGISIRGDRNPCDTGLFWAALNRMFDLTNFQSQNNQYLKFNLVTYIVRWYGNLRKKTTTSNCRTLYIDRRLIVHQMWRVGPLWYRKFESCVSLYVVKLQFYLVVLDLVYIQFIRFVFDLSGAYLLSYFSMEADMRKIVFRSS